MAEKPKLGWRDLADRRVALMLALAFSTGLPFLLVFSTLSVRLREAGIALHTLGMFSWLGLAYSLKFLWAPFVDAIDVPFLAKRFGRRRAWMITTQLFVAAALVGSGASDPATGLVWTAVFTFMVAFGSATQDIVIDAWRIDAAPDERQGIMVAAYQLGYRIAMLCAGAGALYIAEFVDWHAAYFTMAALMSVGLVASVLSPVVDRVPEAQAGTKPPQARRFDFVRAVKEPLLDLYSRLGKVLVLILLLVSLYRMSDFLAGVMSNPLYVDLGFTKAQIASVAKVYGIWVGIIGAFAGGIVVARFGLYPAMLAGGATQAISHLVFAWLSTQGANLTALVVAISVDNFSQSFAGTILVTYMSGLTGAGFAATQYALLSSLYALPGKLVAGGSGFVVEAYGYAAFFVMTAAILIPVTALVVAVRRVRSGGLWPREDPPPPKGGTTPTSP
ncbi:MAG TPA: MFS transporter [Usitatibacter sp.]|nr:MFS transporter [Usitatibacter sp.]